LSTGIVRCSQSTGAGAIDPSLRDTIAKAFARRMQLLSRAIFCAVLSVLITAALLIIAFLAALVGLGHGVVMAAMFVVALVLLMVSLVELTREIRVHMKTMHLD
jgi:sterol desaturase/sphingolipid hydroxylase (fatty acid hydroxylase superfamily)